MVAEHAPFLYTFHFCCSLAKISMVAELSVSSVESKLRCSLAKISMVAELYPDEWGCEVSCSLAKISMVAEHVSRKR